MKYNPADDRELAELTKAVRSIAKEGGDFLRTERKNFKREKVEEKNSHDYVSYVDKESERRLVTELSALLPEAGFIAEEGSATYNDEPYCWVIDPLDGTLNFINGVPHFCISLAVKHKGVVQHGVIYDPVRDELFSASRGRGAMMNQRRIRVNIKDSLDNTFLSVGHAYRVMRNGEIVK